MGCREDLSLQSAETGVSVIVADRIADALRLRFPQAI